MLLWSHLILCVKRDVDLAVCLKMDESQCDPDYKCFNENEDCLQQQIEETIIIEENVRFNSINKIKSIIEQQFGAELKLKENEVCDTQQKLTKARSLLDRLRACTVACYYAKSFTKPLADNKTPLSGTSNHPAIKNVMRSAVTNVLSKNSSYSQPKIATTQALSPDSVHTGSSETSTQMEVDEVSPCKSDVNTPSITNKASAASRQLPQGPRRRICKTVIVGNISKYIPPEKREGLDKSTHKWMVYVRGPKDEPRIDQFVKKVWFFLHPSYRPNDLVEINDSPFHLTRRGWGEFPIRVQLHFCDPRNKPVDILHNLKLDRTYTGLQTLGNETICEVHLDESSLNSNIDFTILNKDLNQQKSEHAPRQLDFDKAVVNEPTDEIKNDEIESTTPSIEPALKTEPLSSDENEVGLVNGDVAPLTNGHYDEDTDIINVKSSRKRRQTVECVVPVKRMNLENITPISTENPCNGIKVENDIKEEIHSKSTDTVNGETTIADTCLNELAENGTNKIENNVTVDEEKKLQEIMKTSPIATKPPVLLGKCIGSFQKVYLSEKTNGPCINFLPNTTFKNTTTVQSNISTNKTVNSLPDKCHTQNTTVKLNGNQSPTKVFILGNGTKIVQNGIASSPQTSTLTLSTVSKTPVRIMPNHKNITINLKSLQNTATTKRRSLSVDSSPQTNNKLPTVFLSPEKLNLLKTSTISEAKKEPVHVIINSNALSKQKIPCKLKQTSQGFLVIADSKNQQKIAISKKSEVQPITVQSLQSILNGGKTIKNIVYPSNSESFQSSPTNCMYATLTNIHGHGKQLTFLNSKPSNDNVEFQVPTATCRTSPSNQQTSNGLNNHTTSTKKLKSKDKDSSNTSNAVDIPSYQLIGDSIHHKHLRNFNDALYVVAPKVSLLSDKLVLPCPTTKEQFLRWNIGKRRVAEWQRAALILKILRYLQTKSTTLLHCDLPSKRYIVKWCALHGYSILKVLQTEDELNVDSTQQLSLDIPDTITDASAVIEKLPKPLRDNMEADEGEVDVVSLDDNSMKVNDGTKLEYVPINECNVPAIEAVEHLSKEIGIKLEPTTSDKGIPHTNVVLAKALQLFVSRIKSESLSAALSESSCPDDSKWPSSCPLIHTEHVASALKRTTQFDFLTDKYIGVNNTQEP